MPRDGSGVLSAPAGTTATAGTTIESAKYNAFVADWVADGNTARPIVAGGTGATTAGAALAALGGQPLDADLTSWAGVTRASNFDTFVATPTSANLRALLTDEVGTGAAYFIGGALGTPASATLTNATGLPFAGLDAAAVVTSSETIAANNNDTTIPTSAAVKAFAEGVAKITSGTAQATTSGTSIDFTGIPAGVRRITITYDNVSLSGSASHLVQLGSVSVQTTGYASEGLGLGSSSNSFGNSFTTGFGIFENTASRTLRAIMTIMRNTGNTWVSSHMGSSSSSEVRLGGGVVTLSGGLDRVRITTSNGTDTFDAGSVNVHWEF